MSTPNGYDALPPQHSCKLCGTYGGHVTRAKSLTGSDVERALESLGTLANESLGSLDSAFLAPLLEWQTAALVDHLQKTGYGILWVEEIEYEQERT